MKTRLHAPFLLLLCVVAHATATAADWPMYRHDAERTGYTSEELPQKLVLHWTHQTSQPPAPAWPTSMRITFDQVFQPIVVNGLVVFGSSADDSVVALDAATGSVRWRFFTNGPVRFAPVAWEDRLFVASDDGYLYAIQASNGSILWKRRGGPNDRKCLGNGRMISRWPIRGGPVVLDNSVYFTAGIWPSDGVYVHALDASTGDVLWSNTDSGEMHLPQPHPGAEADSGVSPQGYLLATAERIFVPNGRSVPAALRRHDGAFEYYRLQENWSIGGSRALIADRFVVNGGCFLERSSGQLGARAGRGIFSGLENGVLRYAGDVLVSYQWAEMERPNRRGEVIRFRGLNEVARLDFPSNSPDRAATDRVLENLPALQTLDDTKILFREADEGVAKQTTSERVLAQARPEVVAWGASTAALAPTAGERLYEAIAAGTTAICGGPGYVNIVDLENQKPLWSQSVEGRALGLAVAQGRLIVSTTAGSIYCFGANTKQPSASKATPPTNSRESVPASSIDFQQVAEEILRKADLTGGICLDLGCGDGRLAFELAQQSSLRIIGVDSNAANVECARRLLMSAGLYGTRVSIHHGDATGAAYPQHVANLIVSTQELLGESAPYDKSTANRLARPYGGGVCSGRPGVLRIARRGPQPGVGQWTHQNANAANTLCSDDSVVGGPLETAWYRDGALEIPDRHAQGPAPLFSQGYLVVEGVHGICGLDAYNGLTLWTFALDGILADWDGVHHDVGVGDTGSNFCLSKNAVFVRQESRCIKLDLATGEQLAEFTTPVESSARNRNWGFIAVVDGVLYGTVLNDEHRVSPRYANIRLRTESTLLFAMDADTGAVLWRYDPEHSIRNNAIAIADNRVYFIDRPIAPEDRIDNPAPNGKHRPRLEPGQHPNGVLLSANAKSGEIVWRQPENIYGTQLAVSSEHRTLLMYYQAVRHNFFRLPSEVGGRMAAFDTDTGIQRWDREVEHRTRPIINGDVIYADGGAWSLRTGEKVPWQFQRSYGCGQMAGSTRLLVFRAATLGYFDLSRDVGTEYFGGIRTGCWFNAIPAGGLVLAPDGSSKCACSYQMRAWLALQPRHQPLP